MAVKEEIFDPDGDVMLILISATAGENGTDDIDGSESSEDEHIRMKVSSKHLSLVSPVFKAMLRPNNAFREGQSLQASGMVDVPLPEDDEFAFRLMLNIVHARHRSVPETITLEELHQLAILLNKYQMIEALEPYTKRWITEMKADIPESLTGDVYKWIEICWVFDLRSEFEQMTLLVVRKSRLDATTIFNNFVPMPASVIVDMIAQRQDCISELYGIVNSKILLLSKSTMVCDHVLRNTEEKHNCDSLMLGKLIKFASDANLHPAPKDYHQITLYKLYKVVTALKLTSQCDLENAVRKANLGLKPTAHGLNWRIVAYADIVWAKAKGLDLSKYKAA